MSLEHPPNALRTFLRQPGAPRLLLPPLALLLVVLPSLWPWLPAWLWLASAAALLVTHDRQAGAGRRALYLAGAALAGLGLGLLTRPDADWREAVVVLAGVLALLLLAHGLRVVRHTPEARPATQTRPPLATMQSVLTEELATRTLVTAEGMVKAAQAIKEVATQQSGGALQQVDVLHGVNERIDQFSALSDQIAEETRAMTRTAEEATGIAINGQQALEQVLNGMAQINTQVAAIGATILRLAQLTRRIDEIITSVGEIATQSNLLALNASIEAARAGAQGRGFAVVAEEVRALSQQSTAAARQIRSILSEIQTAVRETVDATEAGVAEVGAGEEATRAANRVMAQLATNVMRSFEIIQGVSATVRQQAESMDELSLQMGHVSQITQQNLVSARVMDRIAQNLAQLADELQQAVGSDALRAPMLSDSDR